MLALAVVLMALRARLTNVLPARNSGSHMRPERVPEEVAEELQHQAAELDMKYWQARIFALGIVAPLELRQRVVESYKPNRRTLDQQVTVECQIPKAYLPESSDDFEENPLMLPIAVFPKGELQDSFKLTTAEGVTVRDYSHREYLVMVARVLRELLMAAFGVQDGLPHPEFAQAHSDAVTAERYALIEIMGRIQDVVQDGNTKDRIKRIQELAGVQNEEALNLAAYLVGLLSTNYAIVAQLPGSPNHRFAVRYERTLIPKLLDLKDSDHLRNRIKGLFQSYLGARPVRVEIELSNAWTSHSYHLEVEATEGMYLAHQFLYADPAYLTRKAVGAPTKPYPRFQKRLGQSSAHFYARFFPVPEAAMQIPRAEFKFYEVPPGSDFQASVAAVSSFLLILLVGFVISHSNSDIQSDAPAYLLAFPGVAASWLGFDAPENRLLEGSLSAKLSLMLTTLTSLAASGLFIINRTQVERWLFECSLPLHCSFFGVHQTFWAVLTLSGMTNTVWICRRWLIRSWRYSYFSHSSPRF